MSVIGETKLNRNNDLKSPMLSSQRKSMIYTKHLITENTHEERISLNNLEKLFEAKIFPNNNVLPKIQVLVVEDNVINQIILSNFLKKNNIPFKLISNGRDALKEWRKGGYHLILMDIQLPFISGINCAKEIRRLEKINGVGIINGRKREFENNHHLNSVNPLTDDSTSDILDVSKFKQPVIIVALTANSFTEDRDNALAAGCNDFLVKPVNLLWLSKKFAEWGCMQALINFDDWGKLAKRSVLKEDVKQVRIENHLKKLLWQVQNNV